MSMKEIKVRLVSQQNVLDGPTKITVEPMCRMSDFLDACKTYKLVEDETVKRSQEAYEHNVKFRAFCKKYRTSDIGYIEFEEKFKEEFKCLPTLNETRFFFDFRPVKIQTDCMYGAFGDSFKVMGFDEITKEELEEWEKANPNAFKQPLFSDYVGVTKPNKRVLFNNNATILEIGDFKAVVKRDEKDKFSYYIGLGLALSRYYEKRPATKIEIKYLKDELNYKKLAHYCLHKYFGFDTKRVAAFLKSCEKNKWVDLCVK